MRIVTLKENPKETRVAITPQSAKNFLTLGLEVVVEHHAGLAAGFTDQEYQQAGAQVSHDANELLNKANVLVFMNEPDPKNIQNLPQNALIIGHINNTPENQLIPWCMQHPASLLTMNQIPRISRAQSMDSLSSQANLAGYRAVIEAVSHYQRVVPMMMTAAGMVQPAKVLILGAGVAGLQAIATAKRLGAVVYAFDVRHAAKEQVESLGAEFIEVPLAENHETTSGYASEMSDDYKKQQAELIEHHAKLSDIVISTALVPGRKAPILLYKKTVEQMKPGSIIVDLATSQGGNCELSQHDKIFRHQGITLIGMNHMATLVPTTASELYANNVFHLVQWLLNHSQEITLNPEDEIIQHTVLCANGQYLPFKKK